MNNTQTHYFTFYFFLGRKWYFESGWVGVADISATQHEDVCHMTSKLSFIHIVFFRFSSFLIKILCIVNFNAKLS